LGTKIEITKTELVWSGKYDEDGTLKEVPRMNLPFQIIETINESHATREAKREAAEAAGSGLGYCDLMSSIKKLAHYKCGMRIVPACGRQGMRNLKLRTAWSMGQSAKRRANSKKDIALIFTY